MRAIMLVVSSLRGQRRSSHRGCSGCRYLRSVIVCVWHWNPTTNVRPTVVNRWSYLVVRTYSAVCRPARRMIVRFVLGRRRRRRHYRCDVISRDNSAESDAGCRGWSVDCNSGL